MSLGVEIAKAVTRALRESFGEAVTISRRKSAVTITSGRKARKVRRAKPVAVRRPRKVKPQPPVRPFARGEYDSVVLAACDLWRTVSEMRRRPGLAGVIASRLSTKCGKMYKAGKLLRRKRNLTPLEYEYRRIEAAR